MSDKSTSIGKSTNVGKSSNVGKLANVRTSTNHLRIKTSERSSIQCFDYSMGLFLSEDRIKLITIHTM